MLAAAACGKDKASSSRPSISVTSTKPNDQLNMLVASVPTLAATPDERVALLLLKGQDAIPDSGPVDVLFGQVHGQSVGTTIGPFPAERHGEGLPRPYYLVRATFPVPGNYAIKATVQGKEVLAVLEASDPGADGPPKVGQPLTAVPTPTPTDHRGVDPICTATPPCPLHAVSLDAALAEKKPIALLFGTPAFCKTNTCGPVLDVMLAEMQPFADRVRFLHVEIYTDRTAKTTAPAVDAYKLVGEPFLFLAGADGVVRQRMAGPYDRVEFRQAMEKLLAG
ncbi:MAG: hypothetical protein QOJ09_3151 [Actinomycetota bacterium]|nr:hypothetical protein [Actinomycetota bacterium]